jgi:hypothetical protein
MASKILESGRILTVLGMKLSLVGPTKPDLLAAQGVQALQEPSGAKPGSAHLVGDALRAFLDANYAKFFNEFLIAKVLPPKLRLQQPSGAILPLGVRDHFHTGFRE